MPNLPMVSIEIPISAGADISRQPGMVQKNDGSRKEPLAFKKKLEDCIKADDTPYGVPSAAVNQTGGNTQDNSMAANLTDEQAKPQIVGILEGFGLLDYLSDLPLVSPTDGQTADSQTVGQAALKLLQGLTQNTEQTGALEKYARMLSNDQLAKLPPELQQALAQAVGEYLGSFESTNNAPVKEALPQGTGVIPAVTQAAEAAADISSLPDKIASLLIKLKSMQQDARPAEAVPEKVQTPGLGTAAATEKPQAEPAAKPVSAVSAPVEPAAKPETVKPEAVKPMTAQSADQSADNKPVASAPEPAVKPEVKTLSSDEPAVQTQRPDAPVNPQPASTLKTDASAVQQAAKAPEAKGADFVKDNVMRIVDKMSAQAVGGKYDFDVELKPDFLGKVNIKLSMENGEIRMQIKTDDVNVKSMFADQVSSMQAALKDKGIAVTNIDVTYQSQMQTGADPRSYSQNGSGKQQSGRVHASLEQIAGGGVFETMSQITGFTHSGSSVEYLA